MADTNSLRRILEDSTLLGLVAPALLALVGQTRTASLHVQLGISDRSALPGLPELMTIGLGVLVGPLVFLVMIYVLVWGLLCIQENKIVPLIDNKSLPLLAWATAASWLAATATFISIGKNSPVLVDFIDFTIIDLVAAILGSIFVGVLIFVPTFKSTTAKILFGKTLTGNIVLILLLVGGLSLHASFSGAHEGIEIAFGCVERNGIRLDAPLAGISMNTTYVFLAHNDGFYFLREPDIHGHNRTTISVADNLVLMAVHQPISASNTC